MNIFAGLVKYAESWKVKGTPRAFNQEELDSIESVTVVAGEYGNSACFFMVGGGQCYIPMDIEATVGVGEVLDKNKILIKTLCKTGEDDINRVMY